MKTAPCCCLLLATLAATACRASTSRPATVEPPRETSGIACSGEQLFIVGDDDGAYFRLPRPTGRWRTLPLAGPLLERQALPGGALVSDLEGIDVLADGRIVVLSERLAALVGEDGLLVSYPKELFELGNRGLEGLAVRPLADGASRVAVLSEGGHLHPEHSPPELVARGLAPFLPRVLVHDVPAGATELVVTERSIALRPPAPPADERARAHGLVFRAPALVWHRLADGEWGFIVLLASESADATLARAERYAHRFLVRFTAGGEPLPGHVDLDALAPPELRGANWEGLDWLVEGRSLVTVFDAVPDAPAVALAIELPEGW